MSGPGKIIVFGDSIAFGAWDPEGGWVDRLRQHHHALYLSTQNRDNYRLVYNLGVPGDTSTDLLARFDRELDARMQRDLMRTLVCIAIGTNDMKRFAPARRCQTSLDSYLENISKVVLRSQEKNIDCALIGIPRVSNDCETRNNNDVIDFEMGLKTLAQQHALPFVEISKHFQNRANILSEDGVHPNAAGHALILSKVLESGITK